MQQTGLGYTWFLFLSVSQFSLFSHAISHIVLLSSPLPFLSFFLLLSLLLSLLQSSYQQLSTLTNNNSVSKQLSLGSWKLRMLSSYVCRVVAVYRKLLHEIKVLTRHAVPRGAHFKQDTASATTSFVARTSSRMYPLAELNSSWDSMALQIPGNQP